jgi:hypothetical protein
LFNVVPHVPAAGQNRFGGRLKSLNFAEVFEKPPAAFNYLVHHHNQKIFKTSMKRTLKFSAVALLAVLVLWACGGASGPKAVGESFLNAMAKGDIETAKKHATKEAQSSLDMMAATAEAKKANPDKIEIGEIKEDGDKATLSYKENGTDKTLNLVKEDGAWKAAWTKGGGEQPAIEPAVEPAVEPAEGDSAAGEGE